MILEESTDRHALFAAMKNGATIITPNNRLSNQLLQDFMLFHNIEITAKPKCFPYTTFLQILFKKIRHKYPKLNSKLLLSKLQQYYIWQQILNEFQLPINQSLIQEIQDAWSNCQLWDIDMNDPSFAQTPQTQQFQIWQALFQQRLFQLNAITEEQILPYILDYIYLINSNPIIWVSFNDYTPQQKKLQEAIAARGGRQQQYDLINNDNKAYQYVASNDEDEYQQMIHWAISKLDEGYKRIALVVPNLQQQSRYVKRIIQRYIPEDLIDISLGEPLANHPMIAHALNWLNLDPNKTTRYTITTDKVNILLNSPYIGGAKSEFQATAADVMQNARFLQEPSISWELLLPELKSITPRLASILTNLCIYPDKASPYEWINLFKTRLHQVGFPGEYALDSKTYQYLQRFISMLDDLAEIALLTPLLSKNEIFNYLRYLTNTTTFQARKLATNIQILGILEASGCTFDVIWICGLTDQCLPQKTNLSAFIPISIQKNHAMPHALVSQELLLAQKLLCCFRNSCQEIIFSYPQLDKDMPNMPSPLIENISVLKAIQKPSIISKSLLQREEIYQIPLAPNEIISGGTSLLSKQAKCPFQAFAAHRLYAKPALLTTDGLDARERGQMLHKILEILWQSLGNHQKLISLTSEQLDGLLETAILSTLTSIAKIRPHSLPNLIQEIEVTRLKMLLTTYLDWEKQREPFLIEFIEKTFSIKLAELEFEVRVDRIDIVSNNKWVIDYKTTLPSKTPWNEDRPEEPQMLIYALLDEKINALLFLQLKAGEIICKGLSKPEITTTLSGINILKPEENWSDYQIQWKKQLEELATEIRNGHCPPIPTRSNICQQCDFMNLCRMQNLEAEIQ